jgi:phage terminase large subunit
MSDILNQEVGYNKIFEDFNKSKCRYRLAKGSAGSGKSTNAAQDFIKKLSNPLYKGANLLVLRKTDDTNRDSTFAEIEGAINRMFGQYARYIWKTTRNPLEMECLLTGNRIIFRGMNDTKQREKVKSVTFKKGKLTWIWLEEATEFEETDIDILDDRLRGDLSKLNPNLFYQVTMTFNPISAAHWIKSKFFDAPYDDVTTNHSTYLDNRFIDKAFDKRMMRRKERDPDGFKVYGLGEWGELGGLILTNYVIKDFDTNPAGFTTMDNGQDFGFNHANAILELGFKDGDVYVCKELYVHEKDTNEIIAMAEGLFDKNLDMYCDSAEPDRIEMWRKAGYYRAQGVTKSPNREYNALAGATQKRYILSQIDWLKQRTIYVHPSCVNLIKELSQWKWRKDRTTGKYIDEPVDVLDDAIAALRYGCTRQMQQQNSILDVL